jgi:N,N'-diacetyllegionaminate synthase
MSKYPDPSHDVFIVAEIGNNHEGDFELAKDLVRAAAASGADAVKFQTYNPENFLSSENNERLDRLKKFRLNIDQFAELSNLSREEGIVFFSTPLDLENARKLNEIQSIFKIASGDNNYYQLIDTVGEFKKPTIISTGMTDHKLVDKIVQHWCKKFDANLLSLLHCVSAYPVPDGQINLRSISYLLEKYPNHTIGYSDHSKGISAPVAAVALGAKIIEKHFTLSKSQSDFRDHKLSAIPSEFDEMTKNIRKIEIQLGVKRKQIADCELANTREARRSFYYTKTLSCGDVISMNDLIGLRPATGLSVNALPSEFKGKMLIDKRKGDLVQITDFIVENQVHR